MDSLRFADYFAAVLEFDANRLSTPDELKAVEALWPRLVQDRRLNDQFQFDFIRSMLGAYQGLPAHVRVPNYLLAWNLGCTDDATSIYRLPYLSTVKALLGAFMHFAGTAEVLEAFQPLFDEAEALIGSAPDLSEEDFSAAEDELRHRVYRRHSEVRRSRPGLIKWDPDGYS